jgi:integrase
MGRLRADGLAAGVKAFLHFRFHQSRATFATELARVVLRNGGISLAIQIVKEALLHKDEKTTLKYIRFIEKSAVMQEAADAFTREFLGLVK